LPGLLGLVALGTGASLLLAQPWVTAAPAETAPTGSVTVTTVSVTPQIAHEAYKLDNGLEVLLIPDRSVPLVAVDVWYHVGSGYEVPGKSGFAHLFEHMLFQGSKNVGEDKHFDILKEAGASEVNGTTNSDRTNYYEVLPSNQLELALWLESDRMAHLLPMLTEKSLANQRDVVRNERRQRYDNAPYGATRFAIRARPVPRGPPVPRHDDRQARGSRARHRRRRHQVLPDLVRAGQRHLGDRR
jgi:zinc protease